jgi:CBS domain-containing protein
MWDLTVLEAKRYGVYHCRSDATLGEASACMMEQEISALVVVDSEEYLVGILSQTDLVRAAMEEAQWQALSVAAYMSRDVVTVGTNATLADVARRLLDHCIHRVVVVRNEEGRQRPVAVVASSDLLYHLAKEQ